MRHYLLLLSAGLNNAYYSDPTWGNHGLIFKNAGFKTVTKYRYYDSRTNCLDIAGMLADLEAAPTQSVIILHACAHNPTGVDPTKEQWAQIADVIQRKKHFPFFDCAYQGTGQQNLRFVHFSFILFVRFCKRQSRHRCLVR